MSGPGPRTLLAGLVALVAGGALAAGVSAHTEEYRTAINITAGINEDYFYGGLAADKNACEPKRRIELYRKRNGADKLVDKTRSIENLTDATWTIEVSGTTTAFQDGTYYSKALKSELGGGSHKHICNARKSDDVIAH